MDWSQNKNREMEKYERDCIREYKAKKKMEEYKKEQE